MNFTFFTNIFLILILCACGQKNETQNDVKAGKAFGGKVPHEAIIKIEAQGVGLAKIKRDLVGLLSDKDVIVENLLEKTEARTSLNRCQLLLSKHYRIKSNKLEGPHILKKLKYISRSESNFLLSTGDYDPEETLDESIKKKDYQKILGQIDEVIKKTTDEGKLKTLKLVKLDALLKKKKYLAGSEFFIVLKNSYGMIPELEKQIKNVLRGMVYTAQYELVVKLANELKNQKYAQKSIQELKHQSLWELGDLDELKDFEDHILDYKKRTKKSYRPLGMVSYIKKQIKKREKEEKKILKVEKYISKGSISKAVEYMGKNIKTKRIVVEILDSLLGDISSFKKSERIKIIHALAKIEKSKRNNQKLLYYAELIINNYKDIKYREAGEVLTWAYYIERDKGGSSLLIKIEEFLAKNFSSRGLGKEIAKRRKEVKNKLEREKKEKEERASNVKKFRNLSIKQLKDPYSIYLWGLHSKTEITRKKVPYDYLERKKVVYERKELIGAPGLKKRNDIFLQEGLQAAMDLKQGALEETLVAVVDTGVDYNHPDLKSVVFINHAELNGTKGVDDDKNGYIDDIRGNNFSKGSVRSDPMDDNQHGTHVAGTIGAAFDGYGLSGINPWVKILPVKVLNSRGSGTTEEVLRGVVYAHSMGAKVINLSLGGSGFSKAASDIYNCVAEEGSLIVAAAGNSNNSEPHYPGDYDPVISVGAHNYQGKKTYFGNYSANVDISAPGLQILSTVPLAKAKEKKGPFLPKDESSPYLAFNGTSMASPHVAGVASVLFSTFSNISKDEVFARLLLGTSEHKDPNKLMRLRQGAGLVNLKKTLDVNPQPLLHLLGSSEVIEHYYSVNDPQTSSFNSTLKLKNYWVEAKDVEVEAIVLGDEAEKVSFQIFKRKFNSIAPHQTVEIPFKFEIEKLFPESKDIHIQLIFKVGDSIYKDLMSIRVNKYHELFKFAATKDSRPDTFWWLPNYLNWGFVNSLESKERVFSLASTKSNDKDDIGKIWSFNKINPLTGKVVKQETYHMISSLFNKFTFKLDFNEDGEKDIYAYTNFLRGGNKGKEISKNKGLTIFSKAGKILKHLDIDSSKKMESLSASGDDHLNALYIENSKLDYVKYPYGFNYYSLKHYDRHLKEIFTFDFVSKDIKTKVTSCDLTEDGSMETIVSFKEKNPAVSLRYSREENQTKVIVLNGKGKTILEHALEKDLVRNLICKKINGKTQILTISENYEKQFSKNYLSSFSFSGKTLQKNWSYELSGTSGPSPILIRKWGNKKDVILVNYSYDQILVANEKGQALKGWPNKGDLEFMWQPYFLYRAKVVGKRQKILVVSEVHGHIHSFNLDGTYRKSLSVPGNYTADPIFVETQTGEGHLILTGNVGIQKIAISEL